MRAPLRFKCLNDTFLTECGAECGEAGKRGFAAGATHGSLKGVSCASAASCFGVGYYFISGTQLALAEHWNGSAWSVQATPGPAGATAAALTGVSCASAASCTAVGNYFAGSQRSLAERWDGSAWSVQAAPRPAGAQMSFLYAVSCPSAANCTAVGSTDSGALAEQWNGSAWSVQPVPAPAGSTLGLLAAVSCSSGGMCIATGDDVDGAGNAAPLAERWNGSTWSVQAIHGPVGATGATLSGVSCASAASCTAVGQSDTGSAAGALAEHALAEHWNGSAWRVQATARPSAGKLLASVSCSPARACTAVGVAPRGEKGQPVAEQT